VKREREWKGGENEEKTGEMKCHHREFDDRGNRRIC
jgi:hypothetical protein